MKMTMGMAKRARVAALALAGFLGMLSAGRASAQQADVALVYRLLQGGQMDVTRGGAAHTAQVGERLKNADQLQTHANTRAAIRFTDDGSILRLNPNSTVTLSSGRQDGRLQRTVRLEFGEVLVRAQRGQPRHLQVQTSAGVAAVKGTEFVVRVDSSGVTVITLEGVVEFFNQGGTVDIPAGRKTVTTSSSQAPRVEVATPQELQQAQGAAGDEGARGGTVQGTWIEVQLRDATGQTRTLMLQLPADAVRERLEGRP